MSTAKLFEASRLLWINVGVGNTRTIKRNDTATLERNGFHGRARTPDELFTCCGLRRTGEWRKRAHGVYECRLEAVGDRTPLAPRRSGRSQ